MCMDYQKPSHMGMPEIAVERVPELRPLYEHHQLKSGQVLTTSFFGGAMVILLQKLYLASCPPNENPAAQNLFNRIVVLIEEFAASEEDQVANNLAINFVEAFWMAGHHYDALFSLMGKETQEWIKSQEEYDGGKPQLTSEELDASRHKYLDELFKDVLFKAG